MIAERLKKVKVKHWECSEKSGQSITGVTFFLSPKDTRRQAKW